MFKLNRCFFIKAFCFNFLNFAKPKFWMFYKLFGFEIIGVGGLEIRPRVV